MDKPLAGAPETFEDDGQVATAFQIPEGYPGQKPYAFCVRPRIRLRDGRTIGNCAETNELPFEGEWLKFSWDAPDWRAAARVAGGSNLLNWVLTFRYRLEEGA